MYSEKLPSAYSDDELQEAFWSINRDRFPERYELICAEMDARNIEYEDLPQWQRNQRNLDAEVEAAELVRDTISDSARLAIFPVTACPSRTGLPTYIPAGTGTVITR